MYFSWIPAGPTAPPSRFSVCLTGSPSSGAMSLSWLMQNILQEEPSLFRSNTIILIIIIIIILWDYNLLFLGDSQAKWRHRVCVHWSSASFDYSSSLWSWASCWHIRWEGERWRDRIIIHIVLFLDAFLLHGSELHLYSKINIDNVMINTRTVATFSARPTCIAQTSCGQCVELTRTSEFGCLWCEASGHCSDGADRLREHWNNQECHLTNTTTCSKDQSGQSGHTEWRTSSLSYSSAGLQTSTLVSAVVSSVCVLLLVILFIIFIYLYGKYNQETTIGRYIKTMQESYQQFGGDKSKFKSFPSLELGKKISEKAKAKVKPAREFVNPHPGVNNNNVITASVWTQTSPSLAVTVTPWPTRPLVSWQSTYQAALSAGWRNKEVADCQLLYFFICIVNVYHLRCQYLVIYWHWYSSISRLWLIEPWNYIFGKVSKDFLNKF